ncbi:SMP-30/gluconolactonase/LRE family protein [Pelagibacterium montanilacus]|uniref:SMP-30/gluconolactonase/LRE family protein n=1 Tax=Pelagibacterium montanilacus TaxID=2185280 RepID=UPI000F8E7C07|nr:SMP-30/gluconolactonase/LRE family protein [Pelagibacterium montanilacus]
MFSDTLYEVHDRRFRDLLVLNAELEEIHSGCMWAEGPVWCGDWGQLLWSDIPNQRILRWSPDTGSGVFRTGSNFANGNTRDRQGRILTCEHGTRRVTRTEPDGSITVLADQYNGGRLNSPNDLVVHSDGAVWFTDPTYGIISDYEGYKSASEQDRQRVYRIAQDGTIEAMVEDFAQPNGLAFSPNESRLYIADSGASHDESVPRHVRVFDVVDGRRLSGGRVFAQIDKGVPDGLRVDTDGRVWCSAADGVHCFDSDGTLLGKIRIPQTVANLTFGGPRRNRLFITATRSVYALYVNVNGAARP